MSTVSDRLKQLRSMNKLTQKQMGEILGCVYTYYQKMEYGEIGLSQDNLIKLADYFNVSTDYILGRTNTAKIFVDEPRIEDTSSISTATTETLTQTIDSISTLSNRLKELRVNNNIHRKKMAELLNLKNERNYRNYESGQVDVSASKLTLIADFYGVSTDYLLGRTDVTKIFTAKIENNIERVNALANKFNETYTAFNEAKELFDSVLNENND